MRYLSVCSGIEAATVAWHPLGWKPVAFSEVEKFPCAVLKHHYPDVPNWGDMTKFKDWPDANFDVLVGGTPCQSFSVAGLRKGLDDPRGNLMLTYLAIAKLYRPTWVVWENVPGVLSSNKGRDFGTFLGGLGECGYGFAYRILDAQYFGVPQRRRRVFVVGHLGDWRRAATVLFERESLQRHSPPSRETGEGITPTIGQRVEGGGGGGGEAHGAGLIVSETSPTLSARTHGGGGLGTDFDCDGGLVAHAVTCHQAKGGDPTTDNYVTHSRGTNRVPAIAWSEELTASEDVAGTVQRGGEGGRHDEVMHNGIRRLTPMECERLQGFPDGYTRIPIEYKKNIKSKKFAADGPRYKALGNSMAVPCMRWLGERIQAVEDLK